MSSDTRLLFVVLTATIGVALSPSLAEAYIGPGAGLSAFGALLALVAAGVVGLLGFVWFPIKRALRLLRSTRQADGQAGLTAGARKP